MYPTLIEIGGFTITSFGVMLFFAFIAGAWTISIQLRQRGMDPEIIWEMLPWLALGGIAGAKLYYVALHWQALATDPIGTIFSRGGLVWYGGLIGGVLAYFWLIRRRGLPMLRMFDVIGPSMALAYAIGRVGCFLVGDDYGLPTDSSVGVAFPNGAPPSTAGYLRSVGAEIPAAVPDWQVMAVHPTQLYEVAAALVIFAILWKISKRVFAPGRLFGIYLAFYGIERFLIEFVRAKDDRMPFGLTTSQLASMGLLALAAYLWWRRGAREQEAATSEQPASEASMAVSGRPD